MTTRAEALASIADREPGEALDLCEVDLCEVDLRGVHLAEADLRRADFYRSNLTGADLRGANLDGANLRGADLRGADLRGAYLRRANLYGADLSEARWDGLRVDGLPSGQVTFKPTATGWHLRVGCEGGSVASLRALVAGEDWPGADTPEERARRRPGLLALADLCDAHAVAHADVIVDLAARWGTDAEVAR